MLTRVARQDAAAFAELFQRYGQKVKAFMIRAGTAVDDADEIAQDVLVTVWRKAHLFNAEKAAASTWIYTIARNRRIDLIRRRARPEPDPEDPLFRPDPEPTGLEALSDQQLAVRMREGLKTLPDEQREVLRLTFFDGMTHAEAAMHLSLPIGTVKSRIRLAFGHLRTELGEDLVDLLIDA
ncbi:MAG: sigma-70 family RNA polymerase sigma factor [Pseudomonadota bacterium]